MVNKCRALPLELPDGLLYSTVPSSSPGRTICLCAVSQPLCGLCCLTSCVFFRFVVFGCASRANFVYILTLVDSRFACFPHRTLLVGKHNVLSQANG